MSKKLLAAIIFMAFITATCKKSSTPVTPIDITGTWTLNNELQTINSVQTLYEVSVIPCMSENTMTINANGTFTQAYSGNDTCYLYNNPGVGGSSLSFGTPGLTGNGTWTQSGNNIVLTYIYSTGNVTVNATAKTTTSNTQLIITGSDPSIHLTAVITYIK
jgi:hypothetical protein